MFNKTKALYLDYDGVIVETDHLHHEAINKVLRQFDLFISPQQWASECVGRKTLDILKKVLADKCSDSDLLELQRKKRNYFSGLLNRSDIKCREGILPLIVEAQRLNIELAVVSSSSVKEVDDSLRKLGLYEFLKTIVSVDDVIHPKPCPDVYLLALKNLNKRPGEAVAVEDSPIGIASAKAAGLFCVAFPTQFTSLLDLSDANLIAYDLTPITINLILNQQTNPRLL